MPGTQRFTRAVIPAHTRLWLLWNQETAAQEGGAAWEARSAFSVLLLLLHIQMLEMAAMSAPVPRRGDVIFREQVSLRRRAHFTDKS